MDINDNLSREFKAISDEDWKAQVIQDLKGKDFEETLCWHDEDGLKHKPYYRQSDLDSLSLLQEIQAAQRSDTDWTILEELPPSQDPLKERIEKGEQFPELKSSESYKLDLFFYKNKGASPVQELAFGLQHAVFYLDQLTELGLSAKEALDKLEFRMAVGNSYFIEIAKGRAFRYLLKKVLQAYDLESEVHITGVGSSYMLSDKDVHTNLLRTSTQAMSAVLGGYNSIFVPAFNALEETTSFSKRMARNIQLILKEEAKFNKIIDSGSGSYYLESLTEMFCHKAWELFIYIEEIGWEEWINHGLLKEALEKSRQQRLEAFKTAGRKMVGVNANQNPIGKDIQAQEGTDFLAKEIVE